MESTQLIGPPKLIENWEQLDNLETDNYIIEVDKKFYNGHIKSKGFEMDDDTYWNSYLSTHTFYGGSYKASTRILRELGFNIQIKNWDGETELYLK